MPLKPIDNSWNPLKPFYGPWSPRETPCSSPENPYKSWNAHQILLKTSWDPLTLPKASGITLKLPKTALKRFEGLNPIWNLLKISWSPSPPGVCRNHYLSIETRWNALKPIWSAFETLWKPIWSFSNPLKFSWNASEILYNSQKLLVTGEPLWNPLELSKVYLKYPEDFTISRKILPYNFLEIPRNLLSSLEILWSSPETPCRVLNLPKSPQTP